MRDKLKDEKHFNKWISEFYQSLDQVTNWILTGKTVPDKVNFMKRIACGDTLKYNKL